VDYLQFNLRRPALHDPAVRAALAQALDRARLARDVYRGLEVPTDSGQLDPQLGSGRAFARRTRPGRRAQGARAAPRSRSTWRSPATWRSSGGGGADPGATRTRGRERDDPLVHAGHVLGTEVRRRHPRKRALRLALTSWSPALDPDRSYLFGCAALPPAGGNAGALLQSADFDAAEAAGARELRRPAARRAAYRRAHAILARDLPIVPLGFERSAYALSPRFAASRPTSWAATSGTPGSFSAELRPGKTRRALFQEGFGAFFEIVGVDQRAEVQGFDLEAGGGRKRDALVDRAFGRFDRERRLCGDDVRDALGFVEQRLGRDDLLDEPGAQRLVRVDGLARQAEVQGHAAARGARGALRAAEARHQAEVDFGLTEARLLARELMSQPSASSQPPPSAKPFTAAITGVPMRSSCSVSA
jgi:hypothetical protein